MIGLTVLLASAAVVAALAFRWLLDYVEFRRAELAIAGPPSLPILGNTLDVMNATSQTVFPKAVQLWGGRTGLSRFSIVNRLIVFVNDPDDIATLIRRKEFGEKSRFFYEFLETMGIGGPLMGLITLNGADHKRHRAATQPAFHTEVLNSYHDIFVEESEKYVRQIEPFKEQAVILNTTVGRTFVRTGMSSDVSSDTDYFLTDVLTFIKLFLKMLSRRSLKPWLAVEPIFNMTAMSKTLKAGTLRLHKFCLDLMKTRREKLKTETDPEEVYAQNKRKTLMDVLLDAERDQKFHLSEKEILDEVITFIGAAVETTVTTICFAIKMLSLHPEVQATAFAEVTEVLGGSKRSVTLDDLSRMEYLDNVVKETLRLLPAIPFTGRQVHEKTELAGKVLPKGTTLVINIFGVHRDPRYWDEPLRFNPDRFSDQAENQSQSRHPYCYIPYSAGTRNCIGNRYANQLVKTVLATLLRDFRIDRANDGITDHTQLPLTFELALRILGGTKVTFTPRAT